jgi:hypothetical protein
MYASVQPSTKWTASAGIGAMTVVDPAAEKDEEERLSP